MAAPERRERLARPPLDRSTIVAACVQIIDADGIEALTMRRLGEQLDVDATAVYRHFRDKDELLHAVGDHLHDQVLTGLEMAGRGRAGWRPVVRELCLRLRFAHLRRPDLAALVRTGPPLQDNEFLLTETLLASFRRAGLSDRHVVDSYHAVIELTVGSAAIDAAVAGLDEGDREAMYASWRRAYAALDSQRFATTVDVAHRLYPDGVDERFAVALDLLLDGIAARIRTRPHT